MSDYESPARIDNDLPRHSEANLIHFHDSESPGIQHREERRPLLVEEESGFDLSSTPPTKFGSSNNASNHFTALSEAEELATSQHPSIESAVRSDRPRGTLTSSM